LVRKAAIVRDEEIATKKWLSTLEQYDVSVAAFQIGDKITSGPFISQEATVQEIKTHIMF
jgi:transcription antitermination factor NusG